MGRTGTIRNHPLVFLFGLAAVSLLGLLFVPPIPQPQDYHRFADQQTLLGIPNFWNVVSNLPFVAVGIVGLLQIRDLTGRMIFLGVFLTGFSSSYYHWNPNDDGLFWDRLPMSIAFMAILSSVVEERIDAKVGRALLWPLVALGIISLLIWRQIDDLRLYGWVQFFPCLLLPLLFLLFPPKYTDTSYWFIAAALFALAKLFEFYDEAIYSVGSILSGHTFKHVAAAAACFTLLRYFQTRRPIRAASQGMKTKNRKVAKTTR
jgi:hypothetical protein